MAARYCNKETSLNGNEGMAYNKKRVAGNAKLSTDDTSPAGDAETPLEYMLRVMRDSNADDARRDAMAKAALPYMHARLTGVDGQVPDKEDGPISFTWQPPQK